MSKEIKGENGKTYVQKKPFYKKFWFWLLVVVLIIIFSSATGSSDSDSKDSSSTNSTSQVSSSNSTVSKASSSSSKTPVQYTNALVKAKTYANSMDMSEAGVKQQLTSSAGEGFSEAAANYAIQHLTGVNWNKNALAKAKSYQDDQAMSTSSIREQLTSSAGEQFTESQAEYAIQHLND